MCNKGLPETQLAEHVDHCLHGGLIGDRNGGHVENAIKWQVGWRTGRWIASASENNHRLAGNAFDGPTRVRCK